MDNEHLATLLHQTALKHGCQVQTWYSHLGSSYKNTGWLMLSIPVEYQAHPVTAFVLPNAKKNKLTKHQVRIVNMLRAGGFIATWLSFPEAVSLLITGIQHNIVAENGVYNK